MRAQSISKMTWRKIRDHPMEMLECLIQFYLLSYVEESDLRHDFIYSNEKTSPLISLYPWFALLLTKCVLWITHLPREIFWFPEWARAQIYINIVFLFLFLFFNLICETDKDMQWFHWSLWIWVTRKNSYYQSDYDL